MKRFFGIILGLILSAGLGYALGVQADLTERLFEEAGVEILEFEASEISELSQNSEPFENLYLFMYQNAKLLPRTAAIREVALQTVYTEEEVELMVIEGSLDPVFTVFEENGTLATQDSTSREFLAVIDKYEDELAFQLDNFSLAYENVAQEIFMNGDTGDSANIDLLFDLDIVHFLLFGEFMALEDRTGDESVLLSSATVEDVQEVILAAEEDEEEEFSPLVCHEDQDLREALEEFDEYIASLPEEVDTGSPSAPTESVIPEDADGDGYIDSSVSEVPSDRAIAERVPMENFITNIASVKGDWGRELPCNEIFCITVNLVTPSGNDEKAGAGTLEHEPEDNCISCHVSFILERLEQTLEKPLQPGKVPMNFFEDATCKESGYDVNLDLNIYVVKKPIVLDPGDPIQEAAAANASSMRQNLVAAGGLPGKGKLRGKTPDDIDFENLVYFKCGDATQEECQADAVTRQNARDEAIDEVYSEFLLKARAESSLALYEQMSAELQHFGNYLNVFQTALRDTYLQNSPPIADLLNKKFCE